MSQHSTTLFRIENTSTPANLPHQNAGRRNLTNKHSTGTFPCRRSSTAVSSPTISMSSHTPVV